MKIKAYKFDTGIQKVTITWGGTLQMICILLLRNQFLGDLRAPYLYLLVFILLFCKYLVLAYYHTHKTILENSCFIHREPRFYVHHGYPPTPPNHSH